MHVNNSSPRRCDEYHIRTMGRQSSSGQERRRRVGGCSLLQPADHIGGATLLCHRVRGSRVIRHFAYYLYGKCFTVYTDHKPLYQLLSSDRLNGRLRRMSMKFQHWLVTVEYLYQVKRTAWLMPFLGRRE